MRTRIALAGGALVTVTLIDADGAFAAEEEHGTETGTEEEHAEEEPNPILPDTNEIIWGGLAFVVLALLLRYVAFKPVKEAMEARTERIRNNLDDAERVKGEAQTLLDDYQRQLADARGEAGRIIEEARQTADAMRRDLIARAEAEAAELRQRNQAEVQQMVAQAESELRQRTGELAIELAEMVVQRSLDRDSQMQLINSYIDQLQSQRATQGT